MSMPNEEEQRLYKYLIENFPLDCNSHNAMVNSPKTVLKATIEDIAIFILKRKAQQLDVAHRTIERLKSGKE